MKFSVHISRTACLCCCPEPENARAGGVTILILDVCGNKCRKIVLQEKYSRQIRAQMWDARRSKYGNDIVSFYIIHLRGHFCNITRRRGFISRRPDVYTYCYIYGPTMQWKRMPIIYAPTRCNIHTAYGLTNNRHAMWNDCAWGNKQKIIHNQNLPSKCPHIKTVRASKNHAKAEFPCFYFATRDAFGVDSKPFFPKSCRNYLVHIFNVMLIACYSHHGQPGLSKFIELYRPSKISNQ